MSIDFALHEGAAGLSTGTYAMHAMVFYGCAAVAALVFAAMIASIVSHRRSPAETGPAQSMTTDLAWTLVPIAMLLAVAARPAGSLLRLAAEPQPDLTIVATAHHSKWHYEYAGRDLAFFSSPASGKVRTGVDRPLTVPEGAWVRLLLAPDDVVHAWRMPDLELRHPGSVGPAGETWFRAHEAGVYRGRCAEFCGMDHKFMPVVVEAVEPEVFQAWLLDARSRASRFASAE